jgi:hypothetical protein
MKIERLTKKQDSLLPVWRDKWIEIGLSCEPADRPRAEVAYRACYKAAGLHADVPIVWVSSPIVGAFAAPIAAQIICAEKEKAVGSAVYSAVDSKKLFWHDWIGGALWASWAAAESFFRECCELQYGADLEAAAVAYAETCSTAGYWWPNQHFIMPPR